MQLSLFIPVAVIFVLGGTMSTISSKWADTLTVPIPSDPNASFSHPFMQTWLMFVGEFSCFFAFYAWLGYRKLKNLPIVEGEHHALPVIPLVYLIPACCDFTASTTMYIGLTMTQASVFQMLRGATVLFTAILSRILLKRIFQTYQWVGMVLVVVGLLCVGLSSLVQAKISGQQISESVATQMIGNGLIIAGQVVVAIQMVIEERILTKYKTHPMELVGWEGFFGLTIATVVTVSMNGFANAPDDIMVFFQQMSLSGIATLSVILQVISIPLLNAAGQTLTKYISATTRMVFDTFRNIFVWIFTLIFGAYFGETFQWLQLVGFIILVLGLGTYRYIIRLPIAFMRDPEQDAEAAKAKEEKDAILSPEDDPSGRSLSNNAEKV